LGPRLYAAARKLFARLSGGNEIDSEALTIKPLNFFDEVHRLEENLIRNKLSEANGQITAAAKRMGMSYQTLAYIIRHRHPKLLKARSPVVLGLEKKICKASQHLNPHSRREKVSEIDAFLQEVLADQREWDADHTPQTPAYALLAAGRIEEAEAETHKAVSDLEKKAAATSKRAVLGESSLRRGSNTQLSLLADALIAHGIALARLKKLEVAQATLERAIAVAQEAGAPNKAGLAALTIIEELDQLSRETLLCFYEQASEGMANVRNRKLQWRVIGAAKKLMTSFWGEMDSDRALELLLAPPSGLCKQMVSHAATLNQGLILKDASISENFALADSDSGRMIAIIELRYTSFQETN
jgi:tetratricopeptide (TPR) repeat protein